MKWKGRRGSSNIVGRRGAKVGGALGGGGLILGLLYFFISGDPSVLINSASTQVNQPQSMTQSQMDAQQDLKDFISVVLSDTEDTWNAKFQMAGRSYQEPKLVLFHGRVESACGTASSAVGPFYCPADQQIYLDLSFFNDLQSKLGAKGDFAMAYVVAHEVGHHVQNLLGLLGERKDNAASVRTELMADCLAGVWAQHTESTKGVLEEGDVEEAMNAAAAVGDDRLQKRSGGAVVPDSFTHGSSRQRVAAFDEGFTRGELTHCTKSVAH